MGNRIKYLLSLLLIILVFASCKDSNSYVISGSIKGLENTELYIVATVDSTLCLDTIQSKSGKFTYKGQSETVEPVVIYMENGSIWITVWVQNGEKYTLSGNANYPELITVKGGEINKLLTNFKTKNSDIIKERGDLRDKILANAENLNELSVEMNETQLSSQIKNIDQILKNRAEDFVEAHPSSIASLVLIQDYILDTEDAGKIQPFLSLMTETTKENQLYENLEHLCLKALQTAVGSAALDFSLVDIKNDTINLETFKNKYLVLNFAASWCTFCEPEYADLRAMQKDFSKTDLEILTIALDENTADWDNLAVEKEIDWRQVKDSTGWNSGMVSRYNVSSIPCNYLIDKEGVIIGAKISADSIQAMLHEKLRTKN